MCIINIPVRASRSYQGYISLPFWDVEKRNKKKNFDRICVTARGRGLHALPRILRE